MGRDGETNTDSIKADYDKSAHADTRAFVAQEALVAGLLRLHTRANKDAAARKRALDSIR
jgi:hypothetical protein